MRVDAMSEEFETVFFQGSPALFTDCRVDRRSLPESVNHYEIRHADEDWGQPCQLSHSILVNHFGTLLTTEPLQLPASSTLDFEEEHLVFSGEYTTLTDFMEEHPPVERDVFQLFSIDSDKKDWLYSDTAKDAERGVIGHLRLDFDSAGKGFRTSWWPHQDNLNRRPFKDELDSVVNWMRQERGPLRDLQSMKGFCFGSRNVANLDDDGHAYGFQIETKNHQYFLRCTPKIGEYQGYLYCCDRQAQRNQSLEHPEKRPSVLDKLKTAEKNTTKNTAPKSAEMEI